MGHGKNFDSDRDDHGDDDPAAFIPHSAPFTAPVSSTACNSDSALSSGEGSTVTCAAGYGYRDDCPARSRGLLGQISRPYSKGVLHLNDYRNVGCDDAQCYGDPDGRLEASKWAKNKEGLEDGL